MRPLFILLFSFLLFQHTFAQDTQTLSLEQLDSLRTAMEYQGRFPEAIQYSELAIEAAKGQDSIYVRQILYLAFSYWAMQEMDKVDSLLHFAQDQGQQLLGNKHLEYAFVMGQMGYLYTDQRQFDKAEQAFLESIAIYKERNALSSQDFVATANGLGTLYRKTGKLDKIEPIYQQALNIFEAAGKTDDPSYAMVSSNLAIYYERIGKVEAAEALFLQASSIYRETFGDKDHSFAMSLDNLGKIYQETGRLEQAETVFQQASEIFKEVFGERHPFTMTNMNHRANLLTKMERYKEAEALYLKVLAIRKDMMGKQHPRYASALNNLGFLYDLMGEYDKAIDAFGTSLEIIRTVYGEAHPQFAIRLTNLTSAYANKGNYEQAEALLTQSLAIFEERLGQRNNRYISNLNTLANIKLATNKNEAGISLVLQALNLCLKSDSIDYTINDQWGAQLKTMEFSFPLDAIVSLELLYKGLGQSATPSSQQKQVLVSNLALHLLNKSKNNYVGISDKVRSLAQTSDWTIRALKVMDTEKDAALAFEYAELSKSVLLMDQIQTKRAHSFGNLPDSLQKMEKDLQSKDAKLKANLLQSISEEKKQALRTEISSLHVEIDAFKKMLQNKYPKYNTLKYNQTTIRSKDIQNNLKPNTALLEYVVGDSMIYVFYIDNKQVALKKLAIPNKQLHAKIEKMRDALTNYVLLNKDRQKAFQNYSSVALWFYQQLLSEILSDKKDIQQLVIITDGALGHLPFETFLVEPATEPGDYAGLHYLVKDFAITYNYSAGLWNENQKLTPNNNGLLFAMAANYDKAIEYSQQSKRLPIYKLLRGHLQPLPAAQAEVESLKERFKGSFAFNNEATEAHFKSTASEYGILHLAMHGILDNKNPILSSLAFTENHDSIENNFLQAFEISKMELNANLVVLSACETGYGKFEKGNGIASLARAFMFAGASSLVVSLWQVNDQSTELIMQKFYTQLALGLNKAEALRQAKLGYINIADGIAAHPAFWSPFIQLGDSRPIVISSKGGSLPWVLGGLGLCLVGLLVIRRSRTNAKTV